MVADLVPAESRGMAYGTYKCRAPRPAASFLAGILWSRLRPVSPDGPLLFRCGHGLPGPAAVHLLEARAGFGYRFLTPPAAFNFFGCYLKNM